MKKVKIFITLDKDTLKELDMFKIDMGLKSRGEAIKALIDFYKKVSAERDG